MRVENICGVCNSFDESENHLFFHCDFSHRFWFGSPLHFNSHELAGADFLESWDKFCNRINNTEKNEEILQEFAFGLWRLWKNRNEVVFNGVHRQHLEVMTLWRKNISEYREALSPSLEGECKLNLKPHKMANRLKSHWKKPTFGTIKINTDAAWCRSSLRAGILVQRLTAVTFSFVPRESNRAAHSVVKFAFQQGGDFVWDRIGPEFLFNVLAQDVNIPIRL
ncbi:unnamed protein product [Malus baccata var. baccata]